MAAQARVSSPAPIPKAARLRGHNRAGATMSKLSMTWLWLAYLNVVFSSLVIGALAAATHGNPEGPVRAAGISDFGIFAVSLHAIGTLIAVVVLHFLLKRKGLTITPSRLPRRLKLAP
jgi:hypothetical protein